MTLAHRKHLDMISDDYEFYQHQLEGIRQMMNMGGCLLADEMGLGKTCQAITVAAVAWQRGTAKKFLLVCPATLKGNWAEEELDVWTSFSYMILPNGAKSTKQKRSELIKQFAESDTQWLLVNYEQVVGHEKELARIGFDMAVLDEGHAIKGRKSARTKACHRLIPYIGRRFVLTGSPLLNQVDDLWAILHFIDPKEWPSYWTFVHRYAVFGGYMDKQIVGVKNEKELRERLQRYMIRRTKKECLDLPDKIHVPVLLDLLPEQRKMYDQMKTELKIDLGPHLTPFEANTQMDKVVRLRMICGTTATITPDEDYSCKLDEAMSRITQLVGQGEPVVVFTQFRKVHEAMHKRVLTAGIPSFMLHGDVPTDMRRAVVGQWNESHRQGKPGVIVCMYQVGGTGLNMQIASHVIRLDKTYVPLLDAQAEDRAHRIGQKNTVFVYDLLARKTYDQTIEKIVKTKKGIFGAAVETGNNEWKRKLLMHIAQEDD